jgi:regulator of nucleoside diphosphate kinase
MLDTTPYQDMKMVQLVEMITDQDLERILHCLDGDSVDLDTIERWEEKIERAKIIAQNDVPSDVVTMRSRIKCRNDEELERIGELTLVFPHEANIDEGKISILAPLGLALLGAQVGSTITWKCRNGRTRTLVVDSLSYQPEASGDWHL